MIYNFDPSEHNSKIEGKQNEILEEAYSVLKDLSPSIEEMSCYDAVLLLFDLGNEYYRLESQKAPEKKY